MFKRIAIVTLTGSTNFGNRLQNFALQSALGQLGVETVETIPNQYRSGDGAPSDRRRIARLRSQGFSAITSAAKRRLQHSRQTPSPTPAWALPQGQLDSIDTFVQTSIRQLEGDFSTVESVCRLAQSFDCFIVGSDQVWNPEFGLRDHLRFLEFAEPWQRIAYAASIGVPDVPSYLHKTYRRGIAGMAHVSVREQCAAELVREWTGREVPVVLDPTMLLESAEWEALAVVPPSLVGGGFVAEFFLGLATDDEMLPVQQFASNQGLDRIDLKNDCRDDLAAIGPLEFIGAIKASSLLVTDSFHAAVFATIFRVPYLLKGRGAMNSRFDTLVSKSGLTTPKWGTLKELEASIDIDWDCVHHNIARERGESLDYLRTALSLPTSA